MGITHDMIREKIIALLPQGALWDVVDGTDKAAFIDALSDSFARIYDRAEILIREANPLWTDETFGAKETEAGLPDACTGDLSTYLERRESLITKWRSRGGQSPAYYIGLAKSIGVDAEIEEYAPFCAGSYAGDALTNDGWEHHWAVIAPDAPTKDIMIAGEGCAGEPLRKWGNEMLECLIARYKPAHTTVTHKYI